MTAANRRKRGRAAALVVIAVGFGIAYICARRVHEDELAIAASTRRRAVVETEIATFKDRFETAEKKLTDVEGALTELQKAKPRVSAPATAKSRSRPAGPSIQERLQKEPAFQALYLADRRGSLITRYGPLMRSLGLTAAQAEKFHENTLRWEEQQMDLQAVLQARGKGGSDVSAMMKLGEQAEADYEMAQRELLGESSYRQFQDFKRKGALWEMVNGFAGIAVVEAREPLTPQQAEQLVQAIADASSSYVRGEVSRGRDVDWEAVDARARAILSDSQLSLYLTTEPPLPMGGRFQGRFYRLVDQATKSDAVKSAEGKIDGSQ